MDREEINKRLDSLVREIQAVYQLVNADLPQLPPAALKKLEQGICLKCGKRIVKTEDKKRGCHVRCHRSLLRSIEKGLFSEFDAIAKGLLAPKSSGGRRPVMTELEQQLERAQRAKNRIHGNDDE